jgi:hypothetical protein
LNRNNSIAIKKTVMKKNLIITLVLGLFLISCKNSNMRPDDRSGKSVTTLSDQLSQPVIICTSYSIFNPNGETGTRVLYSYLDCNNGGLETGSVEPRGTVRVLAQEGTLKCPGGVVTETGISPKTDPAQSKP